MRKKIILSAVLLMMAGFNFSLQAHEGEEGDKDQTITGEVMDLTCYATHPDTGSGAAHADCARQCIEKGLPAGILTKDGDLYVALGSNHKKANKKLASFAGKEVEVRGHIKETGHTKFFVVEGVKEAAAVSAPAAPASAPAGN